MKSLFLRTALILAIDFLLLLAGAMNIPRLLDRPVAPIHVKDSLGLVVVAEVTDTQAAGGLRQGDILHTWDGNELNAPEAVELFSDLSVIGASAVLQYSRNTAVARARLTLVPAYPTASYAIFTAATAFVCWMLAVFVLVKRRNDRIAVTMHWALVSAAAVIALTYGRIIAHDPFSELLRALFFVSYLGTAAGLLLVASEFPMRRLGEFRVKLFVMGGTATLISVILSVTHISVMRDFDPDTFRLFLFFSHSIEIALATATIGSTVLFSMSYRRTLDPEIRKSILRILVAVLVGLVPLLTLNLLPGYWQTGGRVPEQYTIILLLGIPFTLIVMFLHSTTMNVEVEKHRSLLRAVLSVIVWCVYLLLIFAAAAAIRGEQTFMEHFYDILFILAIAFAMMPARTRFMRSLDSALFPVRNSLPRILREAEGRLYSEIDRSAIAMYTAGRLLALLKADTCAVYFVDGTGQLTRVGAAGGESDPVLDPPQSFWIPPGNTDAFVDPDLAHARSTTPGDLLVWLRGTQWTAVAPLHHSATERAGALCLRVKQGADLLRTEEVALMSGFAMETSRALERLRQHERMIIESEERRRLEELNRMKSFFVSGVSHQLRTPLTSIRMFAEMLREGSLRDEEHVREYLGIIDGEAARLARLIDNVLDFSRIERGIKEYRRETLEPGLVARNAAAAMQYQFRQEKADFTMDIAPNLPVLLGDPDALQEAVMNLLDNALKYSPAPKSVALRIENDGAHIVYSVQDNGVGIEADKISLIFDPFYRARDPNAARSGGSGLGLALVADIVHAHGGEVSVSSTPGAGSTFSIILPLQQAGPELLDVKGITGAEQTQVTP